METNATEEQIKTQLETAFAAYKGVEGISSSVEVKDGKVIQNFTIDYSKTDFAKLKELVPSFKPKDDNTVSYEVTKNFLVKEGFKEVQ